MAPATPSAEPVQLLVTMRYASLDEFDQGFASSVAEETLFISTRTTKPVGTRIRLVLRLKDGRPALAVEGPVLWTVEPERPPRGRMPGMGIKARPVDEQSAQRLKGILARHGPGEAAQAPGSVALKVFQEMLPDVANRALGLVEETSPEQELHSDLEDAFDAVLLDVPLLEPDPVTASTPPSAPVPAERSVPIPAAAPPVPPVPTPPSPLGLSRPSDVAAWRSLVGTPELPKPPPRAVTLPPNPGGGGLPHSVTPPMPFARSSLTAQTPSGTPLPVPFARSSLTPQPFASAQTPSGLPLPVPFARSSLTPPPFASAQTPPGTPLPAPFGRSSLTPPPAPPPVVPPVDGSKPPVRASSPAADLLAQSLLGSRSEPPVSPLPSAPTVDALPVLDEPTLVQDAPPHESPAAEELGAPSPSLDGWGALAASTVSPGDDPSWDRPDTPLSTPPEIPTPPTLDGGVSAGVPSSDPPSTPWSLPASNGWGASGWDTLQPAATPSHGASAERVDGPTSVPPALQDTPVAEIPTSIAPAAAEGWGTAGWDLQKPPATEPGTAIDDGGGPALATAEPGAASAPTDTPTLQDMPLVQVPASIAPAAAEGWGTAGWDLQKPPATEPGTAPDDGGVPALATAKPGAASAPTDTPTLQDMPLVAVPTSIAPAAAALEPGTVSDDGATHASSAPTGTPTLQDAPPAEVPASFAAVATEGWGTVGWEALPPSAASEDSSAPVAWDRPDTPISTPPEVPTVPDEPDTRLAADGNPAEPATETSVFLPATPADAWGASGWNAMQPSSGTDNPAVADTLPPLSWGTPVSTPPQKPSSPAATPSTDATAPHPLDASPAALKEPLSPLPLAATGWGAPQTSLPVPEAPPADGCTPPVPGEPSAPPVSTVEPTPTAPSVTPPTDSQAALDVAIPASPSSAVASGWESLPPLAPTPAHSLSAETASAETTIASEPGAAPPASAQDGVSVKPAFVTVASPVPASPDKPDVTGTTGPDPAPPAAAAPAAASAPGPSTTEPPLALQFTLGPVPETTPAHGTEVIYWPADGSTKRSHPPPVETPAPASTWPGSNTLPPYNSAVPITPVSTPMPFGAPATFTADSPREMGTPPAIPAAWAGPQTLPAPSVPVSTGRQTPLWSPDTSTADGGIPPVRPEDTDADAYAARVEAERQSKRDAAAQPPAPSVIPGELATAPAEWGSLASVPNTLSPAGSSAAAPPVPASAPSTPPPAGMVGLAGLTDGPSGPLKPSAPPPPPRSESDGPWGNVPDVPGGAPLTSGEPTLVNPLPGADGEAWAGWMAAPGDISAESSVEQAPTALVQGVGLSVCGGRLKRALAPGTALPLTWSRNIPAPSGQAGLSVEVFESPTELVADAQRLGDLSAPPPASGSVSGWTLGLEVDADAVLTLRLHPVGDAGSAQQQLFALENTTTRGRARVARAQRDGHAVARNAPTRRA